MVLLSGGHTLSLHSLWFLGCFPVPKSQVDDWFLGSDSSHFSWHFCEVALDWHGFTSWAERNKPNIETVWEESSHYIKDNRRKRTGKNRVCLLLFGLVVFRELRITSSSSEGEGEGEWLGEGALCLSFSPSPNRLEFRFYHLRRRTLYVRLV